MTQNMTPSNQTTSNGLTTASSQPTNVNNDPNALTLNDVENIWVQAGGNPQAAQMAAAVANAESGLNPNATSTDSNGVVSVGLWLLPQNGTPPGSTDPLANARAAVQLSNNGTDWSSWCTTWSDNNCGTQGGQYLGDGANALGALGTQGAYNVIGSQPSGDGTGASTATSAASSTTPATSKKPNTILYIAVLIVIVAVVYYVVRHRTGGEAAPGGESEGRSQAGWTPDEEAGLSDPHKTDKQISQETGRSIRAIRVRRNQLKSQ